MSKKRGKSGSAPTGFGVKWESELMNASLEEVGSWLLVRVVFITACILS